MVHLLPVFFGAMVIGGLSFLVWYEHLTASEKKRADELARQIARELFERSLEELSLWERQRVQQETRKRF